VAETRPAVAETRHLCRRMVVAGQMSPLAAPRADSCGLPALQFRATGRGRSTTSVLPARVLPLPLR